jgi:hypothetical protein
MIETVKTPVTLLVPGDRFYKEEVKEKVEPRVVIEPRPDVITPMWNGKNVRDTSGKIVKIIHERAWMESCSDRMMVHIHTNRGVLCVHREATVERKV